MSATETQPYIPSDSEVATPSASRQVWRISDGKIQTGREIDGTHKTREKVVGLLTRVGVYFGTAKDGTYYGQLEADVMTSDGEVRVKAGLTDKSGNTKPGVAALSFAEGLLEIGKNELFIITASQAQKPNKYGTFTTYANLFHLDPATNQGRQVRKRGKPNESLTMEQRWAALEAEIKTHAAYADRPTRDEEDEEAREKLDPLNELTMYVGEKGWPTPAQAPTEWLGMVAKFLKLGNPLAKLTDHTDGQWQLVYEGIKLAKAMPPALQPAVDRIKAAKAAPAAAAPVDTSAFGHDPATAPIDPRGVPGNPAYNPIYDKNHPDYDPFAGE